MPSAVDCDYTFLFHRSQRQRFRDGELVGEWRRRYPQLFDDADERVLRTKHQRNYNFLEWLAAVLLFESTGYLSLVAKYTSKNHPQKHDKLRGCLTPSVDAWLRTNESGQPDLFVYSLSNAEWFFCEVKGSTDRMRDNQREWRKLFEQVLACEGIVSKGRYRVLCMREVDA